MERRFYLGAGLLLVLLIMGLFTGWAMEKGRQPEARLLEQAAEETQMQRGVDLAMQAKNLWQSKRKAVAAVADHTPMDEIDNLFAELEVYAKANEQVHFASCCSQLASLLRAVTDAHTLNWWNIL